MTSQKDSSADNLCPIHGAEHMVLDNEIGPVIWWCSECDREDKENYRDQLSK